MTLWHLEWRAYPAGLLALIGWALVAYVLARHWKGLWLPMTDRRKSVAMAHAMRGTILGLALVAIAIGWVWQWPGLAGVAAAIALEELWEISVVVGAFEEGERRQRWRDAEIT